MENPRSGGSYGFNGKSVEKSMQTKTNFSVCLSIIAFFLLFSPLFADTEREQIFTEIYEEGKGHSGFGATVRSAAPYMKFLHDFIKKHKIHSKCRYSRISQEDFKI